VTPLTPNHPASPEAAEALPLPPSTTLKLLEPVLLDTKHSMSHAGTRHKHHGVDHGQSATPPDEKGNGKGRRHDH